MSGLGMICIVAGIGHFLDWLKVRKFIELEICFGFLIGYATLFILSPRRFNFLVISLLAIVICGIFNSIALQSLLALPIIIPSALAVFLLLKWKWHLLK
jgi:hypothetical protein